jgi:hypothetical protein
VEEVVSENERLRAELQAHADQATLAEAAGRVQVASTFAPGDCDRAAYQEVYAEYRGLYKRLKGLGAR